MKLLTSAFLMFVIVFSAATSSYALDWQQVLVERDMQGVWQWAFKLDTKKAVCLEHESVILTIKKYEITIDQANVCGPRSRTVTYKVVNGQLVYEELGVAVVASLAGDELIAQSYNNSNIVNVYKKEVL